MIEGSAVVTTEQYNKLGESARMEYRRRRKTRFVFATVLVCNCAELTS